MRGVTLRSIPPTLLHCPPCALCGSIKTFTDIFVKGWQSSSLGWCGRKGGRMMRSRMVALSVHCPLLFSLFRVHGLLCSRRIKKNWEHLAGENLLDSLLSLMADGGAPISIEWLRLHKSLCTRGTDDWICFEFLPTRFSYVS
jgi:hypothetical protein